MGYSSPNSYVVIGTLGEISMHPSWGFGMGDPLSMFYGADESWTVRIDESTGWYQICNGRDEVVYTWAPNS